MKNLPLILTLLFLLTNISTSHLHFLETKQTKNLEDLRFLETPEYESETNSPEYEEFEPNYEEFNIEYD